MGSSGLDPDSRGGRVTSPPGLFAIFSTRRFGMLDMVRRKAQVAPAVPSPRHPLEPNGSIRAA